MTQISEEDISNKVITAPNVITLVRFLLIPVYLVLLFAFHMQTAALVLFVVAACTDWVDGQVARRTHQVSRIGMLFDPLVDRFLIASGVISIYLLGRIPLWALLFLVIRDLVILVEGRLCLYLMGEVPRVSYVGKFATAFIMAGFAFLFLGLPVVSGLNIVEASWLPGLCDRDTYFGIFLVYIGIVLSFTVFCMYQVRGIRMYLRHRAEDK